jgi:hypothetical protein
MAKPSTGQKVRSFLEQLRGKQRQAFERLRNLLAARDRDSGRLHDISRCVEILHRTNTSESLYGQYRIRRLQETLVACGCPCSRTLLFRALKVARYYTPEEIEGLPDHVTQDHLLALVAVADDKQRRRLLKQAVRQGWSVRTLRHQMYRLNYRPARGGRKRSPEDHGHEVSLRELRRLARKWQGQYDSFWKGPQAPHRKALRQQARGTPAQEWHDELRQVATLFKELAAAAGELAAELRDLSAESDGRQRTKRNAP